MPDDTRSHVIAAIKKILAAKRDIPIKVFYTDDWRKDRNSVLSTFEEYKQEVIWTIYIN